MRVMKNYFLMRQWIQVLLITKEIILSPEKYHIRSYARVVMSKQILPAGKGLSDNEPNHDWLPSDFDVINAINDVGEIKSGAPLGRLGEDFSIKANESEPALENESFVCTNEWTQESVRDFLELAMILTVVYLLKHETWQTV